MSEVFDNIINILEENNIGYEHLKHDHVHSSIDAAKIRGIESPKEGVKSLIFKTKEKNFILVLVPGDKRADSKRIKRFEKTKDMKLASPEEVEKLAGVTVGSVGPFGLKTDFKTYFDKDILINEFSYFSPGTHLDTIKLKPRDLLKILKDPILF